MVCRASRYSSAMVTFARDMTSLEDNQVLSINHQLMREAGSTGMEAGDHNWQEAIQQALDDYRAGRLTIGTTSHNPIPRLESAASERPDSARIFAGRRLIARCQQADAAQKRYLERYARDMGVTEEVARSRFQQEFAVATEHSVLQPSPMFVSRFSHNPDNSGIAEDRRTMYALEMMETARLAQIASTRTLVADSIHELDIAEEEFGPAEVRWNAAANHIEIDFVDPQEGIRTELYRADQAYINSMESRLQSDEIADIITELRRDSSHHYESNREAGLHRWNYRCSTCGQFANVSHNCPVIGSQSSIEADIAALAGIPYRPEASQTPTVMSGSSARYLTPDGIIRMPGINRLQTSARDRDIQEFSLNASINNQTLEGTAEIIYNGYGNGYSINMAASPGDAGDRRLRCSCPEYQERRYCHHIDILQDNLSRLLNNELTPSIEEVREALPRVAEAIQESETESVESAIEENESWQPSSHPLSENYEEFQDIYQTVRQKRSQWQTNPNAEEFPIAYRRENAFNGLSTRANRRGFGIEIEFAFPHDMPADEAREARVAIANELADLGLTRDSRIRGYGASHGWVRDNHNGGWSFEEDFSAGGRDGHSSGEIVSPIMYDEPETWTNIQKICNIIKSHGGFASRGAGQHIHVSTGDYDHRVVNHNRLLSIIAENEDLLYRLSVEPRRGRHRGYSYCRPNSAASAPYSRIRDVRSSQSGHNLGVNFQSVSGRDSDHAEFRMFDSSLEPAVIQAQIGMSLAMVAGAKREVISAVPSENHMPLGSRLESNPRREALSGEAWKEQTVPVRKFIDKYIPTSGKAAKDNPLAQQIIGLFAMTKWQRNR